MCQNCNYSQLLSEAGLEATAHRLRIMEVVGGNTGPLNAQEIFETLRRSHPINRVTVYRILETLVQHGLFERLSGGRASYYGLAANAHHQPHPHFFCRRCGRMDCLRPEAIALDLQPLARIFPGHIEKVAVRVDGVCQSCLTTAGKRPKRHQTSA
jgi:Fur family ferric uptake transcriptional regulator